MKSLSRILLHLCWGLLFLCLPALMSAQSHSARSATFALDIRQSHSSRSATFPIDLRQSHSVRSASFPLELRVEPVFTSAAVNTTVTNGVSILAELSARGIPAPTFSVQSGALPDGLTLSADTGVMSGRPTTSGTFKGVFAATNTHGTATQAFSIVVVSPPVVSYAAWAAAAGLSGADAHALATPFHDGVPNLLKYAFNMNREGPDARVLTEIGTAGLPLITATGSGGQRVFTVTFLRRRGSALSYEAQESNDLVLFRPLIGTVTTVVINGNWERVTIEAAASEAPRRFFRVSVALSPTGQGFALIPSGELSLGDSFAEGHDRERPVHSVSLGAFYLARHETTKAHWDEVRTWGLAKGYTDLYEGAGKAADHPVQNVSWNDIVKWCNAASERDGLVPVYRTSEGGVYRTGASEPVIDYANNGYRLPSEAEWEMGARGGLSGKRFPWGDSITHGQANYQVYSSDGMVIFYAYDLGPTLGYHPSYQSGGKPYTSPVGGFVANGHGLYDMAGNVWEWCNDWYGSTYYANSPSSDPQGPTTGTARIFRGGSWDYDAYACRVAIRNASTPDVRFNNVGFRLARGL